MPKQKQPVPKLPNLKEFLGGYEPVTLRSALLTFEDSTGWALLRAYLKYVQRGYEVDALDKITKKDELQAAAYASGYAKNAEDVADNFLQQLHEIVLGKSNYHDDPRPEE